MNTRPTLDYLAATVAQKIVEVIEREPVKAKDVENLVTKALGVLQSQGVYAMALFLFSRSGKETQLGKMKSEERIAVQMLAWLWPLRKPEEALQALRENKLEPAEMDKVNHNQHKQEMLEQFAGVSQDLDTLLLVRDLYEQTLIYARYHAKALGDGE